MSEIEPVAALDDDAQLDEDLRKGTLYAMQMYDYLRNNTVAVLQQAVLTINKLPAVAEGGTADLWFAAVGKSMVIDESPERAWTHAGAKFLPHAAIQRRMIVSGMRGSALSDGQRRAATSTVDAGSVGADLWVTEMQSGCTVLILDWGNGRYSMVHLQPSEDEQFNWLGQGVMGLGGWTRRVTGEAFFRSMYKNAWLKQEMSGVVGATGGQPRNYIMVQSMFEASRKKTTQVIGVRKGSSFAFYRQRDQAGTLQVDALKWSGWWSWFPAVSSRTY